MDGVLTATIWDHVGTPAQGPEPDEPVDVDAAEEDVFVVWGLVVLVVALVEVVVLAVLVVVVLAVLVVEVLTVVEVVLAVVEVVALTVVEVVVLTGLEVEVVVLEVLTVVIREVDVVVLLVVVGAAGVEVVGALPPPLWRMESLMVLSKRLFAIASKWRTSAGSLGRKRQTATHRTPAKRPRA